MAFGSVPAMPVSSGNLRPPLAAAGAAEAGELVYLPI